MDLEAIQQELRAENLDGWLFFDHHRRDPLAYRILPIGDVRTPTRRWYYFVPASGEPRGLVHRVEPHSLDNLPGTKIQYSTWSEQRAGIEAILRRATRVAMQYSPNCAVPYVAMVDAGTVDLVRTLGVEVMTSADLVQIFEARWTTGQLDSHLEAGRRVDGIRRAAFQQIGERQRSGCTVTEYGIKEFILEAFRREGLSTDHGPIVAVNGNASDPHYEPSQQLTREITRGDFVLIDLWAKLADVPDSVYYDITWTGFCGGEPPSEIGKVFEIVREARDRAVRKVQEAAGGVPLRGFEVDDAARSYIAGQGFGDKFVHRTGHSIGTEVHGAGANIDNFETHDERKIIPGTCFSVEPGIYLERFGIRSEVNVFVGNGGARVTGEVQTALVRIQ